jgi:hypothetical protein
LLQRNLKQNKKQEALTMKYETTSVVRCLQQRCKVPKGDYDKDLPKPSMKTSNPKTNWDSYPTF